MALTKKATMYSVKMMMKITDQKKRMIRAKIKESRMMKMGVLTMMKSMEKKM